MADEYALTERYTITCAHCDGAGCSACRGGEIAVYVLEQGATKRRCRKHGHKYFGSPEHATREGQLPKVIWCQRCDWRMIQTDVPEAYEVVA